ncbi:MAG: pilus assembly protein PilM [Candidatus Omnitrophica bacterium]|nr:pilus assembly protein PilM [Candidatus Omnitrophota bacterium]
MPVKETKITGLYVGSNFVDLMQLERTSVGPRLVGFAREEIVEVNSHKGKDVPPNEEFEALKKSLVGDPILHNPNMVVQAIKRAIRKSNLKVKEIIVNLPLESAMVRYFQIPLIPEPEWRRAIKFEAKRHIPFAIEEVFFDFQVVPREEEKRMEVMFTAVQKREVEKIVSVLAQMDLKVLALEPISSCVSRILQLNNQINPAQSTVVINIVGDSASVNILKNNIFYLVRDIKIASETAPEEEEKSPYANLLNEIKFSFNYYEKKLKQEKIDKIILCSDGEIDSQLLERFKEDFKIKIELGEVTKRILNAEGLVPGFCFAAGLALRGLVKSNLEANLWQQEEIIRKVALEKENFVKTLVAEGMLAILILGGVFFITDAQVRTAREELDKIKKQVPEVSAEIRSLSFTQLESKKKDIKAEKIALGRIMDKRIFLTKKLNEFNKVLPDNLWLKMLSWSRNPHRLDLKGGAFLGDRQQETESVTQMFSNIRKNAVLREGFKKDPKIGTIGEGREGKYRITNFDIKME